MGRRGCPLKNLTEGPAGRDMSTGKSLGNKSVMVPAARAWGWTPPTTASLTQETDPRDLQIIFQLYLCLVSKSVGSGWGEWKILTTKMCLILRMTNMKTEPGRLRIKTKQKHNQFCFKVEKGQFFKPLEASILKIWFPENQENCWVYQFCLCGVLTEMRFIRKNQWSSHLLSHLT